MQEKSLIVDFQINDNGCPVVGAPERAYATFRLTADSTTGGQQVIVEANRRGLVTLARWLIALADQDSNLDHQHFDNDTNFGFFKSDDNTELIVQRVGR